MDPTVVIHQTDVNDTPSTVIIEDVTMEVTTDAGKKPIIK